MSYQNAGGGMGRNSGSALGGGGGAGGMGLNDVARQASKNLNAIASQVQASQVLDQASKAAAQAGGMLSSWLSTAATQASTLISDGTGAGAGAAASARLDLRNDLRRNLASAPPAAAGGKAFVGFSSDDYQRSHTNGSTVKATVAPARSGLGESNGSSAAHASQPAPYRTQQSTMAAPAAARTANGDLNSSGWGGFEEPAEPAKHEKNDGWGSWD
jgi:hypothetical protein